MSRISAGALGAVLWPLIFTALLLSPGTPRWRWSAFGVVLLVLTTIVLVAAVYFSIRLATIARRTRVLTRDEHAVLGHVILSEFAAGTLLDVTDEHSRLPKDRVLTVTVDDDRLAFWGADLVNPAIAVPFSRLDAIEPTGSRFFDSAGIHLRLEGEENPVYLQLVGPLALPATRTQRSAFLRRLDAAFDLATA